jgi:hypothetical protein
VLGYRGVVAAHTAQQMASEPLTSEQLDHALGERASTCWRSNRAAPSSSGRQCRRVVEPDAALAPTSVGRVVLLYIHLLRIRK